MPSKLLRADFSSKHQDSKVLRERCYLLHKTKLKVIALREYVKGKALDTCPDVFEETERLDVLCSNHVQVLKNAYPELGICFVPCCNCGRVGGVLTQLANGEYIHINSSYCTSPCSDSKSHYAAVKRTFKKHSRTVNLAETAIQDLLRGGNTNGE